MRFRLKAIAPGGTVEAIDLQAHDRAAAVHGLECRGYTVLSVTPRRTAMAWRAAQRFPVTPFSQELRVLLCAGVPLLQAVETLAEKEQREPFRAVLERLASLLREGRPLSAALEQFPHAFSPLYVATVKASEKTSDLPASLARYVLYATQLEAVRKRIVLASIYPALLTAVGGMVTLFLLLYVVPRFAHIYQERGTDLPVLSRLLLEWGQAVEANGALVGAALLALAGLGLYLVGTERARLAIGNALWQLPAVGERLKAYQLARFYRTTGMLLRGGVPLVRALDMGAELLHPLLRARLAAARRAISEGRGVSQSLDAAGLATPVALRMLAVGEQGGNMGDMLEQIAVFHDEELARRVEWFVRLFEPLLMGLIGLVIGGIVVLMYLPIFELAGNLR